MRNFMTNSSQARRCTLVLVIAAAAAAPGVAQRQPLVMTHGIRSNAATWDSAAFALHSMFPVTMHRFTTKWKTPYLAQANELLDSVFAGLPDTTLVIGHSNGGLVLRQAALINAPLRGLLTVGSPNQGAPAADAIRKNYMGDIMSPMLVKGQAIALAFDPPDYTDAEEQWYYDYVGATGSNMIDLVNSIFAFMEFDPSYAIWQGMYPSSPFMQAVNGNSSLELQAQNAPTRGYIRTYIDNPDQAVWRLVAAQQNVGYLEGIRDFAALIAIQAYYYYEDKYCYQQPYQTGKCNASSLFAEVALDLYKIEGRYCYKMLVENAVGPVEFPCFATDAVVPFERQVLLGPPGSLPVPYEVQGPSHTEQPKSTAVRNLIARFLEEQANVARCGFGPVYLVQIAAQASDLIPGTTTPLPVSGHDRCLTGLNSPPPISSVTSSDPAVATATVGGSSVNVHAIANGVATITAVMNGVAATRAVAVGAGANLSVEIIGGPRENLMVGETVGLNSNVTPGGQSVSYEWRVDGGSVISSAASYGHYFQGPATITLTVTNSIGMTASATAYLTSGGNQFRTPFRRQSERGRP